MNNNIDWSKAPEGATHYCPETDRLYATWYKKADSGWMYWLVYGGCKWNYTEGLLPNAIARPAEQEINDLATTILSICDSMDSEDPRDLAKALHNAGYRKTEQEKNNEQ